METIITPMAELAAKLATADYRTKFNGKVYAGFIYVNNEKIAVDASFSGMYAKAEDLASDVNGLELLMNGQDGERFQYVLTNL